MNNRLLDIFLSQGEYMLTLRPIYEQNGFHWHSNFPYPLDERWSQEGFRLLAWRITEEIYEALEVWQRRKPTHTVEAYREEVADVLHFFIELCICAGITPGEIGSGLEYYEIDPDQDYLQRAWTQIQMRPRKLQGEKCWYFFLEALSKAMMGFRQRPWRTDDRPTNRGELVTNLSIAWFAFASACLATGITADSLYDAYFHKKKINEQRVVDAKANLK